MFQNPALDPSFSGMTGEEYLGKLIPTIIQILLVVGFLAFVFTFLLGAVKWITAGGDKGKHEEAKQTLTLALIGVTVVFLFWGILSFIECFFGIGLRQVTFGLYKISFGGAPVCN